MSFSVEENAVFIHEFSKIIPTVGGETPLPPTPSPPPPLARSARSGSVAFAPSHITAPKIKSWLRHCLKLSHASLIKLSDT